MFFKTVKQFLMNNRSSQKENICITFLKKKNLIVQNRQVQIRKNNNYTNHSDVQI